MSRTALFAALSVASCVDLDRSYDPVTCPSPDLPARAVTAADLPGALFDPEAPGFPIVSVEIAEEDWKIVCENGRDAAKAYDDGLEPQHFWASVRFQVGDEVLDSVGMRFMGRSTVRALFAPQAGEDEDGPLRRCLEAFGPKSVRYDPTTGEGTFAYRPSFKLGFDQFSPGREFHGQSRLAMAGETGFRTLVDEWLPNQLFAAAGLPHVRAGHAALCINGTYRGLFMTLQEDDDQNWLDDHFAGLKPDDEGAFFKVDPFGPQTYHSEDPLDYANSAGDPYYDPRAGTTEADTLALLDLFKVGAVDTRDDDVAFRTAMAARLDLNRWLKVVAMEMAMGDIDGMYANRNNYMIVQRDDGRWVPVRRDPDLSFYGWWREDDPVWHDWPGMSEVRGPSLLCLRPRYSGARPNCLDGSAPPDLDNPGHSTRNVRRPALAARLVNAFLDDYLNAVEDLLGTVLVAADVRAIIERRAALIEPWVGSPRRARLDPWGPDYYAWSYNLRGDGREICRDGETEDCIDCRTGIDPAACTLLQAVDFYLQQAALQLEGIRNKEMPAACPRDEPLNPSFDELLTCPND